MVEVRDTGMLMAVVVVVVVPTVVRQDCRFSGVRRDAEFACARTLQSARMLAGILGNVGAPSPLMKQKLIHLGVHRVRF